MTRLIVTVTGDAPASQTAAPGIVFRLRIETLDAGRVHAIALRCQTRIESRRRRYSTDEHTRLYELFGDPSQWDRNLQSVTWGHSSLVGNVFLRTQ